MDKKEFARKEGLRTKSVKIECDKIHVFDPKKKKGGRERLIIERKK